jgi:hypothetical protein
MTGTRTSSDDEDEVDLSLDPSNDAFWIKRCRSAYQTSQSWFDTSIRKRMEDSMRMFNSEHTRGSRYADQSYDKRSKLFRPKTRAGMRKMEAAAVAAYFATEDAVNTTAPNPADKNQRLGAEAQGELLNYRLQNDIPWFLTLIGALQDAAKQGVVISKQVWVYRETFDAFKETEVDEVTNATVNERMVYERRVIADHPDIILRPVENVRFSPAADWRNPLQSSPYLIDMEPFYVGDIVQRAQVGPQGPKDVRWRKLDRAVIRSAMRQSYDPIRQAREGIREDRYEDATTEIQDHDIVWVHHNYMREDGQEWYFATLGTEIMLSDVVPLSDTTPLKERPYVMGFATVESHKPYPSSLVELGRPLQDEINDITNLRIDNIRHVLSPRYFIKRGTSVDVRSLLRNVPGGVTAMEDPQRDVHIRQIQDTTASSFREQQLLAIEYDDLIGNFNQSTVMNNHQVTERVGNTQALGEQANQITEMTIRTFSETWVEPALQQVMELERALESDEVVLIIIGQRMGVPAEQVFRMMDMPVKVTINVGFGATNPQRRLQKVGLAFQTLTEINPMWVQQADMKEVVTEVLGAVGFKSADRFFPSLAGAAQEDPQVTQLKQENEQLKGLLQSEGQKYQSAEKIAQMQIQSKEKLEGQKLQLTQQTEVSQLELEHKIEAGRLKDMQLDYQIKSEQNAIRKQELVQQRISLQHTIAMDERQFRLAEQQAIMSDDMENKKLDASKTPDTKMTNASGAIDSTPQPKTNGAAKPAPRPEGKRIASPPKMGGDDKPGVIARDNFGAVPFEEG